MVPDHGTQYEGNPPSHKGGKRENRQTDRLDLFLYFPIPPRGAGTNKTHLKQLYTQNPANRE